MYTREDYKTKKALREAVKAFLEGSGEPVMYYQPGLGETPTEGRINLEGPHYPKPHTWYAEAVAKDGIIVSVK